MTLLKTLDAIPADLRIPRYNRAAHGVGIVHVGLGAFMRAHLAIYTEDAIEAAGGDWRIASVGLRSRESVDALNAQNGLYTLLMRGAETEARVPGVLAHALHAPSEPETLMALLAAPATRIVSLTITEKGYGIDTASGGLDLTDPAIAADLRDLSAPQSAVGLIVAALARRRRDGTGPFTVLSCDNLPENGKILKRLVLQFAERIDPALAGWIGANVTFPSTMVDRITPPQTEKTRADAEALVGAEDMAAIETEPFSQWVVEDNFCAGRPAWEKAGAVMVTDARPYERMKLTMLNGTHSMLAYAGFLAGHRFVREAMGDFALARLIGRHMRAAAATLDLVPGIDLDILREALLERFANPAIDHPTYQIAMDGTQKLPTRIFDPALVAIARGQDISSFAFTTAAWMAFARGKTSQGDCFALRDPREAEIACRIAAAGDDPDTLYDLLSSLPGFMPEPLAMRSDWRRAVQTRLATMLVGGMSAAIDLETERPSNA